MPECRIFICFPLRVLALRAWRVCLPNFQTRPAAWPPATGNVFRAAVIYSGFRGEALAYARFLSKFSVP